MVRRSLEMILKPLTNLFAFKEVKKIAKACRKAKTVISHHFI